MSPTTATSACVLCRLTLKSFPVGLEGLGHSSQLQAMTVTLVRTHRHIKIKCVLKTTTYMLVFIHINLRVLKSYGFVDWVKYAHTIIEAYLPAVLHAHVNLKWCDLAIQQDQEPALEVKGQIQGTVR